MRVPLPAVLYITVLTVAALVAVGVAVAGSEFDSIEIVSLFVIFSILAVFAELYATWIPTYNWEISSSIAIYLAALFILGPHLAVLLVFVASLLSEIFLRANTDEPLQTSGILPIAFNVSQLVLTVTLSGLLFRLLQMDTLELARATDFALAVAVFAVYLALNLTFVTAIVSITERKPFLSSLVRSTRQFIMQYWVLCVSALLLTALYSITVWHVFLALFPLTLVHVSFRGYVRLQTEARNTFERISQLLDARDHYTAVHSAEVAELAMEIAWELGFSQQDVEQVEIAARVHDIGKIAVPDAILLKPGPLNEEEWEKMREHPVVSAELISGLEIYSSVADAVRHEHERWDGTGYPDGLKGEEIPLLARVIAAADIYNALSTDRPYRKAFSRDQTIEMIKEMRGAELDPEIAQALLRVIEAMPAVQSRYDDPWAQWAEA